MEFIIMVSSILISIAFTLVGCVFTLGILQGIKEGVQEETENDDENNS